MQHGRFRRNIHPQFSRQNLLALGKLVQRGGALAVAGQQFHQQAMARFAGWFQVQQLAGHAHAVWVAALRQQLAGPGVVGSGRLIMKKSALFIQPVVKIGGLADVELLQKFAAIEQNGRLPIPPLFFTGANGLLENGRVYPNGRITVQPHGLMADLQEWLYVLAQLQQHAAQVAPGVGFGQFSPEQGGQGVAGMRTAVHCQITEQRLRLPRIQPDQRLIVEHKLQWPQHRHFQYFCHPFCPYFASGSTVDQRLNDTPLLRL